MSTQLGFRNRLPVMGLAVTLACAPAVQPAPAPTVTMSAPTAGSTAAPTAATQAATSRADSMRQAARHDSEGETAQARALYQRLVDSAPDPAAKAAAQRAMAMSYAFDADCANAVRMEEQVIAYWVTREQAEPQNAFYQQGEMANEAARVCIDAGDIDTAERLYRRGTELGQREPAPRTHARSL